jgi:uncharacterized membrane protein
MKTIITLLMALITVIAGIASYNFFTAGDYYTSAILTVAAHLSASLVVYTLVAKKKVSFH